jgi:transcriptional regulator with XRE-family HTH domain
MKGMSGRRLAQLRRDTQLTQQAGAAHFGIAQRPLAHYEAGRLRLPVAVLPKLAALFGVAQRAARQAGPHPQAPAADRAPEPSPQSPAGNRPLRARRRPPAG